MAKPPPGGSSQTPEQSVAYAFSAALALGIYLATFVFTIRWTLFSDKGWKRRKYVNWPMVFVAVLIFVMTMAYTALDLKGTMDEIRLLRTNPSASYNNPMWMNVCKVMLGMLLKFLKTKIIPPVHLCQLYCSFSRPCSCTLCNLLSRPIQSFDVYQMYRCYTLYANRAWIIAIPGFLWIGGIICTIIQAYLQIAHSKNPNLGPYKLAAVNMTLGPGIALIPFWGSTALLNIYCTSKSSNIFNIIIIFKKTPSSSSEAHPPSVVSIWGIQHRQTTPFRHA